MHLAKHMQFHGVNYRVVPEDLWEDVKQHLYHNGGQRGAELYENMIAYDCSNEPAEIPNE